MQAQQYWNKISFTVKFYILISTVIFLFSLVFPQVSVALINVPEYTIWKFQIWRLFTSVFAHASYVISGISLLLTLFWMNRLIKDQQTSTVYHLIEVLLLAFQINIGLLCLAFFFTLFFQTEDVIIMYGFAWFQIILVYEFRNSAKEPQKQRRFCYFPFTIKNKHFPWVIMVFAMLISVQIFCLISAAIIGYYQQVIRKQMLIRFPFSFYVKFQSILPNIITNRSDFVKIATVQQFLKTKCSSKQSEEDSPQQIVTASNGQAIGGQTKSDNFKNHWAQKYIDQLTDTNTADVQIEPTAPYRQISHQQALSDNNHPKQSLLNNDKKQRKYSNLI